MGRKSKLTETQWMEIERRLLDGEAIRALAREYGIAESTLREKKTAQVADIRAVATKVVEAEREFQSLPISAQVSAQGMIARLRSISDHLSGAAEYGAATAHRLNALAHSQVEKIDDAEPMKSEASLRTIAGLTKLANDSASIGLNLLAANKERVKALDDEAGRQVIETPAQLNDAARLLLDKI